jgi:hypothetical protein
VAATGPGLEPRRGLIADVVDELRWTFRGRKGWLVGIVLNLLYAYVYLAVTQGDPREFGDIKSVNVGIAVGVWCLADPINTNQLGADCEAASLEHGDSVPRILAIKNLALVVVLVPLVFLLTAVHRAYIGSWRWTPLLHQMIFDVGLVLLWQGVGSVVSVLLPFRTISIGTRFKARWTWLRYGACQAVPYVLMVVVAPMHIFYLALYANRTLGPLPGHFIDYALVYVGMGMAWWGIGLGLAALYGRFCRRELIADLHRDDWALAAEVSNRAVLRAGLGHVRRRLGWRASGPQAAG